MDAKRQYADAVDRFVELLHGFVATKHPHTTARSHMFVESPSDLGSSVTGEKLGPIKPVIVHDGRAVSEARKKVVAAAIAAGEPLKSLLVAFTKTGDSWSSTRVLLSEADAQAFERDLVPLERALYAALGALLGGATTEASVTVMESKPEPKLSLGGEGPYRTGTLEGDALRATNDLLRFFAERGREVGRVVWTVKQGEEPSHDLYYA